MKNGGISSKTLKNYSVTLSLRFIVISMFFFISCSEQSESALSGSYEGEVTYHNTYTIDGDLIRDSEYTLEFEIELRDESFVSGDCKGDLRFNKLSLTASSDDCGCWCDCDPEVDCQGHPILGSYEVSTQGDMLMLNGKVDQFFASNDQDHLWISERDIVLKRK